MIHYLSHEVNTGFLSEEHKLVLGVYSFWQSIKKGGVGSPKVRYISGLSGLDILLNSGTDSPQVNFELAKNALLIRVWFQGDCFIAYIFWKDILNIDFNKENECVFLLKNEEKLFFKTDSGIQKNLISFFKKTPV